MIDVERFRKAMVAIGKRTASVPEGEQLTMYHQFLSPLMSTEEFLDAAKGIWISAVFFPPPQTFLKARSRREWGRVMELVSEFTPPNVSEDWAERWSALSEASRQAIKHLGGPLAFKTQQLDKNVARAYELFKAGYTEAIGDLTKAVPIEGGEKPLMSAARFLGLPEVVE